MGSMWPHPHPMRSTVYKMQLKQWSLLSVLQVIFETREQGQHVAPPPAASRFIVRDRGSAGPRHMRSTINLVSCAAAAQSCVGVLRRLLLCCGVPGMDVL
eukprot:1161532-Pelagomonas_calceolata.AAC.3